MNIVIVGTAYPLRGAMAQLNAILGRYLSKKHKVEVVTFTRQYPALLFPGKTQIDPSKPLFDLPTIQLIDSINPLSWIQAARYIQNRKPDLLIFRYWLPFFAPCFGVIARLVRKRTDAKVMFICDNIVPHEKRIGDEILTKFAFRFVDYFIVHSKSVENDLLRFVPNARYRMVPHPVYEIFGESISKREAQKKLGLRTDERVILFFGYVRPYKGLHVLLKAMPKILRQVRLKLLVVGEFYDDEEKYRRQIAENGLQNNVVMCSEYMPNEEVEIYFSACDVLVLPYISATQSGIVQIAYHFDKPVIATDVGGLSEVVLDGRTGFLVLPERPDLLADAVIRFYKEKRENKFAKNVRVEKKKYRWDAVVKAVEELAQAATESRQPL